MARQFVRSSSQYASRADHANVSGGDTDFTVFCWAQLTTKPAGSQMRLIDKYAAGSKEYTLLHYTSGDRFEFAVSANGSADSAFKDANNFGAPSTGVWYPLLGWHDSVNNQVSIEANGVAETPASHSGGVFDGSAAFELGRTNGGSTFHLDGLLAEVAFWRAVLTADERAALAKGFSPLLVRPQSLTFYAPLSGRRDPEAELKGGLDLTLNASPAYADHPRVLYPRRRQARKWSAGAAATFGPWRRRLPQSAVYEPTFEYSW